MNNDRLSALKLSKWSMRDNSLPGLITTDNLICGNGHSELSIISLAHYDEPVWTVTQATKSATNTTVV